MSGRDRLRNPEEVVEKAIRMLDNAVRNLTQLIMDGKASQLFEEVHALVVELARSAAWSYELTYDLNLVIERLNMLAHYAKAVEIRYFYLGSKRIQGSIKYIEGHLLEILNILRSIRDLIKQ